MEQLGAKNQKLGKILAFTIAAILVAYIALMILPILSYTRLEPAEVKGMEENVSLLQYLWTPYNFADLTSKVLPNLFTAEIGAKYAITNTIYVPLFVFVICLISIPTIIFGRKRAFSVIAPFVWSLIGLLGYIASPFFNLSIINSSTKLIHIILFAVVLVLSVISFILVSIPRMKYVAATKEKF